jgi:hypothetical protein
MANSWEQELSLQLCIVALMQKEELSDSRNRQAAETKRGQNEDQIWQRFSIASAMLPVSRALRSASISSHRFQSVSGA